MQASCPERPHQRRQEAQEEKVIASSQCLCSEERHFHCAWVKQSSILIGCQGCLSEEGALDFIFFIQPG